MSQGPGRTSVSKEGRTAPGFSTEFRSQGGAPFPSKILVMVVAQVPQNEAPFQQVLTFLPAGRLSDSSVQRLGPITGHALASRSSILGMGAPCLDLTKLLPTFPWWLCLGRSSTTTCPGLSALSPHSKPIPKMFHPGADSPSFFSSVLSAQTFPMW